jgi:hypothetical protein
VVYDNYFSESLVGNCIREPNLAVTPVMVVAPSGADPLNLLGTGIEPDR